MERNHNRRYLLTLQLVPMEVTTINENVTRMRDYQRQVTASKKEAVEALNHAGIFTPEGKVAPKYKNLFKKQTKHQKETTVNREYERRLVWDARENEAKERTVLWRDGDNECIAVSEEGGSSFLSGGLFVKISWLRSKPLPTACPRTNAEMRGFISNTSGIELIAKGDSTWIANPNITSLADPKDYLWRKVSPTGEIGPEQEFTIEVNE